MRTLLGIVIVMAASTAALATDKCLQGSSQLGDQRALATVRASFDSDCPCASFTGAPGLDKHAYRTCAKGVVDAAVAGATLRSPCKGTAGRMYKKAVCGTVGMEACARVKPTSHEPHTCAVKVSSHCQSSSRYTETACAGETYCSDVVDRTASTCHDTQTFGPYVPGVRVITFTKQSVVDPQQTRVLDTDIWYPAPPGSAPVDGSLHGVVDAPVDPSGGPYPVVMFSHGSCGFPGQSSFLWPLVASYGYVVVAPPHPGNTISDGPDCGSAQSKANSAMERPQDIIYALNGMLAENQNPASPFFGALDDTRIGMAGHSFGGFTVYRVLALDTRFSVAIPMAPAVVGNPVLGVPSLIMLSTLDTYVDDDTIRTSYASQHSPKFSVEIQNAGHFAFSDGCFPSPDCNPPVTLTQDEAHAVVLRFVPAFLEQYLRGDTTFAPFLLPPAPAGALLQAG